MTSHTPQVAEKQARGLDWPGGTEESRKGLGVALGILEQGPAAVPWRAEDASGVGCAGRAGWHASLFRCLVLKSRGQVLRPAGWKLSVFAGGEGGCDRSLGLTSLRAPRFMRHPVPGVVPRREAAVCPVHTKPRPSRAPPQAVQEPAHRSPALSPPSVGCSLA